jgi:hypothetical protein
MNEFLFSVHWIEDVFWGLLNMWACILNYHNSNLWFIRLQHLFDLTGVMMIQHYVFCGNGQLLLVIVFDISILHIKIFFLWLIYVFLFTLIVFFIFLITLRFLLMIKLHNAYLTPTHEGIRVLNHVEIKWNHIPLWELLQDSLLNLVNMVDWSFNKNYGESLPIVSLIANGHSIWKVHIQTWTEG